VNISVTLDGPSVKDVTVSSGNVNYVGSKAMATLMMQAVGEKTTATISYEAMKKSSPLYHKRGSHPHGNRTA